MSVCARLLAALGLGLAGWMAQAVDNTAVLNLEPNPNNPRNSEGAFVTLKSGRILFLYQ